MKSRIHKRHNINIVFFSFCLKYTHQPEIRLHCAEITTFICRALELKKDIWRLRRGHFSSWYYHRFVFLKICIHFSENASDYYTQIPRIIQPSFSLVLKIAWRVYSNIAFWCVFWRFISRICEWNYCQDIILFFLVEYGLWNLPPIYYLCVARNGS
jgi:hypothetical protein